MAGNCANHGEFTQKMGEFSSDIENLKDRVDRLQDRVDQGSQLDATLVSEMKQAKSDIDGLYEDSRRNHDSDQIYQKQVLELANKIEGMENRMVQFSTKEGLESCNKQLHYIQYVLIGGFLAALLKYIVTGGL